MFAYRLAMWMGRVDVDAMMNEITPEQFNGWIAAWRAGLLRDQWEQAGTIAAEIHNGFNIVRQAFNDKSLTSDDYYSWKEYDPTQPPKKKKKINRRSLERFQKQARARYGS